MKNIILSAIILLLAITSMAQVRPDIYDFDPSERAILVNLMMQHITPSVIEDHCVHTMVTGGHIHSDFDFLPFHRMYIERMEDFLIQQGYPEFVPLPAWDPETDTPIEFQVIDPDCASAVCSPGHPASSCAGVNNWSPNILLPNYLSLPIQPGPNNDICDWNMDPITVAPDGCCPNGLSSRIEVPWHDGVHVTMQGLMGNFRSPAAPIFWLWHAYVDDVWKSWEENCPQSTTQAVDLYMKDSPMVVPSERDRGEEPNPDNGPMWISSDIWCRNQDDGLTNHTHENPISDGVNPVHVYVRVRNRGYQQSIGSGTEKLKLYWAKAATALTWPDYWNGSITSPALMGDEIGTMDIPIVKAQNQTIMHFTWMAPNPSDYDGINNEPWHFCLLARIEAPNDPMFNEQLTGTWNLGANVRNNNNIVWKNVSVIDMQGLVEGDGGWHDEKIVGANVAVGNATAVGEVFEFEFGLPGQYHGDPLFEEAEVKVTMDDLVWQKWLEGGSQGENIQISRIDRNQVIIKGNPAKLNNMAFEAHERGVMHLSFNFLTDKIPFEPEYEYHLIQRLASTGEAVGGEMYHIIPPVRNGFMANAGPDKQISLGDDAELNAFDIGESAVYNWYSPEGELIFTGKNLVVSPHITKMYKLEVIARQDGIKDYDQAQVEVKEFEIISMSPNPANYQVLVEYKANTASSAYLIVMLPYGGASNQYILDVQQSHTTIDLRDYQTGAYNVILVCNGQAVESKTLIIQ